MNPGDIAMILGLTPTQLHFLVELSHKPVFETNGALGAHNSAVGRTIFGTIFSAYYYNTYTLESALGKS